MRDTTLRKLYCVRQLSMMEIASTLGVTHATVLYWLKKHGIPRRSWSESTYQKLNPYGDPFSIPSRMSRRQRQLLTAGLLLFWAEGNKGQTAVRLANLDPRMLQLFMAFLREACRVREDRLYLYVRVHRRFSLMAAKRYWASLLHMAPERVHVYQHTDQRSQVHKQWSPYGLATLQVHSSKLKAWLERAIEDYLRALLGSTIRRTQDVLNQKQVIVNGYALNGSHRTS